MRLEILYVKQQIYDVNWQLTVRLGQEYVMHRIVPEEQPGKRFETLVIIKSPPSCTMPLVGFEAVSYSLLIRHLPYRIQGKNRKSVSEGLEVNFRGFLSCQPEKIF